MPTPLTTNGTITQERLRELVHYDPLTGIITNLTTCHNAVKIGSRCGWLHRRGWRYVKVDGITYRASRLAWFYVTGEWPDGLVDHENRIKDDDRWGNLRPATNTQNARNTNLSTRNTSGVKGVGWYKKSLRWYACIRVDRKLIHLGYFLTIEVAAEARRAAELRYFGEFAPA